MLLGKEVTAPDACAVHGGLAGWREKLATNNPISHGSIGGNYFMGEIVDFSVIFKVNLEVNMFHFYFKCVILITK